MSSNFIGPPEPLPVKELGRISPSQYKRLRECPLRGIWEQFSESLLPVSPRLKVGGIIHGILESVNRGELDPRDEQAFRERWNTDVEEAERDMESSRLERRFIPLSKSVPKLEVLYHQALRCASHLFEKKHDSTGNGAAYAEKWVESSDGRVGGYIDHAVDTGNGIILQDYKSGSVFSDGDPATEQVKESYTVQMKLYAGLYNETHGIWPELLQLVTLDGTKIRVDYTPDESVNLLDEARALHKKINREVRKIHEGHSQIPALGSPGADNCSFCGFRPSCKAYWKDRPDTQDGDWPCDLQGVTKGVESGSNDQIVLKIQGPPSHGERTIHAIEPVMLQVGEEDDLPEGRRVAVYNLYQKSEVIYKATIYTVVYVQ